MRDYIYVYHEPENTRIVVSGIEFRDTLPELEPAGGVVLLRHDFADATYDAKSQFEFVTQVRLSQLAGDDIYGYGDFCWTDFGADVSLADLSDESIAELTFFAHQGRPLRSVAIPGLANRFLWWAHDDGWYARVFYRNWQIIESLLRRLMLGFIPEAHAQHTLESLSRGRGAFWCQHDTVVQCEQSEDINAIQAKHLTSACMRAPPRGTGDA
ncbi:MAG: hypothetical protein HQ582_21870 [Planctomycetes bacterium]|nr:hypothetical protein [Planctomycetota bacterium]